MRKPSRHLTVLAALALAGTGAVVGASTAAADSVTRCIGTAGDVALTGDLVVPADRTCILEGSTVYGDVRVQSGASLIVTDGSFTGRMVVANDGFADATGTTIGGNVVSNGAYGISLTNSDVAGNYLGRAADTDAGFLYSTGSQVTGRIEIMHGGVYLESTRVGRFVSTEGTTYTDVIDSTIARELTVAENAGGAVVCASEVDGNATFVDNAGVQIGTGAALAQCDGVNYFGSDVSISATTEGTDVTGNLIRGDLSGSDNDPVPTGGQNRVRGEVAGQFSSLHPARDLPMDEEMQDLQADDDARGPVQTLTDRDERREDALAEGERLGAAEF